MAENDFTRQQQAAVDRMREMNSRSQYRQDNYKMPPVPNFVKVNGNNNNQRTNTGGNNNQNKKEDNPVNDCEKQENNPNKKEKENGIFSFLEDLNIPFLGKLKTESDIILIIGIALILYSEKADKLLLFALLYILM